LDAEEETLTTRYGAIVAYYDRGATRAEAWPVVPSHAARRTKRRHRFGDSVEA
jgi:hypothetical protein